MNKNFLKLLLLLTFIKGIIWAGITPFFQAPDELVHYAITQNIAEFGKYSLTSNLITEEAYKSVKYLEVEKIAFKPKNRQNFSNSINGVYEKKIENIKKEDRITINNKIKINSQNPPLYYFIGSLFYKISPVDNLIWRVYFLRIYSIICFILTIYFSYKAAVLIFGQKNPLTFVIPSIVSFLPMVTFINSSINSDNLFLLLVTIIIYLMIKETKEGLKIRGIIILGVICALAFLTRQNFIPIFLVVMTSFFINEITVKSKQFLLKSTLLLLIFLSISGIWYLKQPIFRDFLINLPYNFITGHSHYESLRKYGNYQIKPISYGSYMIMFIRHQEPKKIFNYFWGTFGCVDTRLPRIVYYLLFILCLISFFGFLKYLWKIKNNLRENLWIWEMIFLVLFFSFSMSYYEWRYYQVYENYFLQGRYFFPLILPLIIFLVVGWQEIIPKKYKLKALFFLIISMIVFNFYCLFFIMIPRYYSATSFIGLVIQLSQYKPEFLKGIMWPVLLVVYLILIIKLIKDLCKLGNLKKRSSHILK